LIQISLTSQIVPPLSVLSPARMILSPLSESRPKVTVRVCSSSRVKVPLRLPSLATLNRADSTPSSGFLAAG